MFVCGNRARPRRQNVFGRVSTHYQSTPRRPAVAVIILYDIAGISRMRAIKYAYRLSVYVVDSSTINIGKMRLKIIFE